MRKRLIDANALVMDLRRAEGFTLFDDKLFAIDIVGGQDTVDAVGVVHGRWVIDAENHCHCTHCQCGRNIETQIWWEYCPHCGAKMDLED
jgi:hypothetical protein